MDKDLHASAAGSFDLNCKDQRTFPAESFDTAILSDSVVGEIIDNKNIMSDNEIRNLPKQYQKSGQKQPTVRHNGALPNMKTQLGLLPNLNCCDMVSQNRWALSDQLICGNSQNNSTWPPNDFFCSAVGTPNDDDAASETVVVYLNNKCIQVCETSIALAYVDRSNLSTVGSQFEVDGVVPTVDVSSEVFALFRNSTTSYKSAVLHNKSSQTENTSTEYSSSRLDVTEHTVVQNANETAVSQATSPENGLQKTLTMLKSCFPDVLLEDLEHVLKNCDYDAQWAINVLLDSGYEMGLELESIANKQEQQISPAEDDTKFQLCTQIETVTIEPNTQNNNQENEELTAVEPNTDSPCFVAELSLDMATQLQQIFGSADDELPTELINPQKLKVELNHELAAQLYEAWQKTQRSNLLELQDPEFYQFLDEPLLQEEQALSKREQTLLDEQYARQILDNEDKLLNNALNAQSHALSTKIKLRMLTDMFSDVDHVALRELFKANNYNLEQTIMLVCESLNLPIDRMRRMTKDRSYVADYAYPSLSHNDDVAATSSSSSAQRAEDSLSIESEDLTSLSYEDLRQRAIHHYQKRRQYFEQAREAFNRKMASVATYYAQMGRIHDAKLKEANRKVAQKILQFRKVHDPQDTLDLHGLHVQEAISALAERLAELQHRSGKQLNIVTGSGKHSFVGPKIKPAVETYLTKRMYKFYEINSGMIQVTIS